jgi:hypothetical protein
MSIYFNIFFSVGIDTPYFLAKKDHVFPALCSFFYSFERAQNVLNNASKYQKMVLLMADTDMEFDNQELV